MADNLPADILDQIEQTGSIVGRKVDSRSRGKPQVYGSPNLEDATARMDRLVNNASDWLKDMIREVAPRVMNRPLGSVPVSREDQLADFQQVYRDPAQLAQIHAQRMQQLGQAQGTTDFIKWYKRNLKRMT